MPENITRIGYKKFDKNKKPFCHNCNIEGCLGADCFTCCDEQKENKILKSPDYMFRNDSINRKKFF